MVWNATTRTVGLSTFALVTLLIAALTLAEGCSGKVSSGTPSEGPTRSVAEKLGLGATATALELEVLTTACTASGREDVFRLTNRGTTPVTLSDISFKYWADDTSGQSLLPTVPSGGVISSVAADFGCVHDVSGVTAVATSFSPACGPDATHQANWELTVANADASTLPPGASWSDIRVDLALADGSVFTPGAADWYSPCLSSTDYTTDVHFGIYDQGNLITANGVMTAPSCRPPSFGCLAPGQYSIPVAGPACGVTTAGFQPTCTVTNTTFSGNDVFSLSYDPTSGWSAFGFGRAGGVLGPLVRTASGFTLTAPSRFCSNLVGNLSDPFPGAGGGEVLLNIDCQTASVTLSESCMSGSGACGLCSLTNVCGACSRFNSTLSGSSVWLPATTSSTGSNDAGVSDASGETVVTFDAGEACVLPPGASPVSASSTPVPIVGLAGAARSIVTGTSHACALMADGSVACWGDNSSGQLGLGNGLLTLSSTPIAVPGVSGATALAAGGSSTCALLAGGTVTCWGSGGAVRSPTPAAVPALIGVTAVTVSSSHACALLAGGSGVCWGDDTFGELGDGTTQSASTPVAVSGLSGAVAVSAGNDYTCALLADGTTDCWGRNDAGQLGIGSSPAAMPTPTPVATATAVLSGAKQLAASATGGFTCASGGVVACWGGNGSGALGNGTTSPSPAPVPVSGACGATSIASGASHACALLSDGRVICWGDNTFGELGNGTTTSSATPVAVAVLSGVASISAGGNFTCALLADGSVACWGDNSHAALGIGSPPAPIEPATDAGLADAGACAGGSLSVVTTTVFPTPVTEPGLDDTTALVAGYGGVCALKGDGTVQCTGYNAFGQLGDGTLVNHPNDVSVAGLSGVTTLGAGQWFNCAVLSNGTVDCWGYNGDGELGSLGAGFSATPQTIPGLAGVTAVSGDYHDVCALLSGGGVRCWGDNTFGELGNGTFVNSAMPTPVANLSRVQAIATGSYHNCALLSNGKVRCWGDNTYGQLGNSHLPFALTPVAVAEIQGARAISSGRLFNCALLRSGDIRCWGDNSSGELGNGTTASSAKPTTVSGLHDSIAVASGELFACALRSDGTVRCWGDNSIGELGDGTTRSSTTPVVVSGLQGVTAIVAGAFRACALISNGSVKCWGYLGDDGGPFPPPPEAPAPSPPAVPAISTPSPLPGVAGARAVALSDVGGGTGGYTCALLDRGGVQCVGDGNFGELGDGQITFSSIPVSVSGVDQAVAVTAGSEHACSLLSGGSVACWGNDAAAADLGDGNPNGTWPTAVVDAVNLGVVVAVAAGNGYTCGLLPGGTVECLGEGPNGLGDGSTFASTTAVSVPGLSSVTAVVAGDNDVCMIASGRTVQCWGFNFTGQLGNGTTDDSPTPVRVPGLHGVTALAVGPQHSCAALASGKVACWGDNTCGQLGVAASASPTVCPNGNPCSLTPIVVAAIHDATSVVTGGCHTCALRSNGTVACWGDNTSGELGDGTSNSSATPRNVPGLRNVTALGSAASSVCAVLANGSVNCWGDNSEGQIGYPP